MTSWLSKTTLQKLLDLSGLHCTTSEKSSQGQEHAAQLLVQALVISRQDFHHAQSKLYKWFRMQQHDLVFNEPERAHVTPLFISLHWLSVVACIKFKTLMLAYRTATGSAHSYFHSHLRSLRSTGEQHLVVPSQRCTKSLSRTFLFTVPGWWNDIPFPIRNAESQTIFKWQLKTDLFRQLLIASLKKSSAIGEDCGRVCPQQCSFYPQGQFSLLQSS